MTSVETLFVDGAWVPSSDGATREIRCPADGSVVGVVSEATSEDTERAIAAARRAFDAGEWSSTPASERGALLLAVADRLRARKEEFVRAETLDTGKRPHESEIDMDDIAACFDYFGKLAGQDAAEIAVPHVVGAGGQADGPGLVALPRLEQAEVDRGRVLGE